MIRRVITKDFGRYKSYLPELITKRIIDDKQKVLFVECLNCINQYMFSRQYVERIMEHLFVVRIEVAYDLLDLLGKVRFNYFFMRCDLLLVSSFKGILNSFGKGEQAYLRGRLLKALVRLGNLKEVIILEPGEQWDTQYRLSEISSTQS